MTIVFIVNVCLIGLVMYLLDRVEKIESRLNTFLDGKSFND